MSGLNISDDYILGYEILNEPWCGDVYEASELNLSCRNHKKPENTDILLSQWKDNTNFSRTPPYFSLGSLTPATFSQCKHAWQWSVDFVNLLIRYDLVNGEIRKHDTEHLVSSIKFTSSMNIFSLQFCIPQIFFESVTWEIVGIGELIGFEHPPGGEDFKNRSVNLSDKFKGDPRITQDTILNIYPFLLSWRRAF